MGKEAENKTLIGVILAGLMGLLPGMINALLDVIAENVPVVGKHIHKVVWSLIALAILQWLFWLVGFEDLNIFSSAYDGAVNLVSSLFAASPPVAVVVDVPITVEEAVAALKAAAALGTDVPGLPGT